MIDLRTQMRTYLEGTSLPVNVDELIVELKDSGHAGWPIEAGPVRPRRPRPVVVVVGAALVMLLVVGAIGIMGLLSDANQDVINPSPSIVTTIPPATVPTTPTETSVPIVTTPPSDPESVTGDQVALVGGVWEAVTADGPTPAPWLDGPQEGLAAYDIESDLVVSIYGYDLDSFAFDTNTGAWTALPPPEASFDVDGYGTAAYEPLTDRVVIHTERGTTAAFDTDSGTRTELVPAELSPSVRRGQAMIYDSQSEAIVLFGGGALDFVGMHVDQPLGDTWIYDPQQNVWSEQFSEAAPLPRMWPAAAYDSESDRLVLFGGATGWKGDVYGDTWLYDVNSATWTEAHPAVSPAPRAWGTMWYDPDADLVFLYGGTSRVTERPLSSEMFGGEELWAYDLDTNTWTLYQVDAPNPGFLVGARGSFDTESGAAVVFNGFHSDPETGQKGINIQTWVYRHVH